MPDIDKPPQLNYRRTFPIIDVGAYAYTLFVKIDNIHAFGVIRYTSSNSAKTAAFFILP